VTGAKREERLGDDGKNRRKNWGRGRQDRRESVTTLKSSAAMWSGSETIREDE
jgi:hypothetical protein